MTPHTLRVPLTYRAILEVKDWFMQMKNWSLRHGESHVYLYEGEVSLLTVYVYLPPTLPLGSLSSRTQ